LSATLAAGQQTAVFDGVTLLGYATTLGTNWSYVPTKSLAIGSHSLTAKVVDAAAALSGTASAAVIVIEQIVSLGASISGTAGVTKTGSNAWAIGNGQPTLTGTLGANLGANEVLAVYDNVLTYLGTATVTGLNWGFTPASALGTGAHSLGFHVQDAGTLNNVAYSAGRANSAAVNLVVDGSIPTALATITGLSDNTGPITGNVATGGMTDDVRPVLSGALDVALTGGNQSVQVFDNGSLLGTAAVNGFNWNFTPSTALASGSHSFTANVLNLATGLTTGASTAFSVDEQSIALTGVTDHIGPLTGNVLAVSGMSVTDDSAVTLSGTLGHALLAGQVVAIYDGALLLGTASTNASTWSLTPSTALAQGTHSFTAQIETSASPGIALTKNEATSLLVQTNDPIYSNIANFSLFMGSSGQTLDLRNLNTVQLREVNVVQASNTLKVTAVSLAALGISDAYTGTSGWMGALVSGDKQLAIDGSSGGTVHVDATGWALQSGTVTNGAVIYNSYVNGTAQLLIDNHLSVQHVL
jgi:hypothetical protein